MKKEHILVIRFSSLGDIAMIVPVVWSLANQYPDVRITVLSRAYARTLFDDLAPNVNFMEADLKIEYHGIKGLNALCRRLVAKQFTKVADLHNVLRSEYLRMRFNLGRYRVEHINKHRKDRRHLVSHKKKIKKQLPTTFENYLEVFRQLGYPVDIQQFHSIFPEEGGNLLFLGIVASMLCFLIWNWVIGKLGAVVATNWVYLNPVTTIIYAWWLLNERITICFLLGTVLILVGMVLADKKNR